MRDIETIRLPAASLDRYYGLREEVAACARYVESKEKYRFEDALRSGTATTPEKIKAAWANYGGKAGGYFEQGRMFRVMAPQVLKPVSFRDDYSAELGPCKYETFDFEKTVTHNSWGTVTRIHCGGLTVSETVKLETK